MHHYTSDASKRTSESSLQPLVLSLHSWSMWRCSENHDASPLCCAHALAMHITIAAQVRTFVNSLGAAFSRRSDEAQASNLAHQLSLGVFALEDALAHGRPYAAAASQLARSAPEDELVASACKALPQAAAERVSDGSPWH